MKSKQMQELIKRKFHFEVFWCKCYRERYKVMSLIECKITYHYDKVPHTAMTRYWIILMSLSIPMLIAY